MCSAKLQSRLPLCPIWVHAYRSAILDSLSLVLRGLGRLVHVWLLQMTQVPVSKQHCERVKLVTLTSMATQQSTRLWLQVLRRCILVLPVSTPTPTAATCTDTITRCLVKFPVHAMECNRRVAETIWTDMSRYERKTPDMVTNGVK